MTTYKVTTIYETFTKTYCFFKDIVNKQTLLSFMKETLLTYQEYSQEKLKNKFSKNMQSLIEIIPTNQKLLHIAKLEEMLSDKTFSSVEQELIEDFKISLLSAIKKEAILATLPFEEYKQYILALIQYAFVDNLVESEKQSIIQEIEIYKIINASDIDSKLLFEEFLSLVSKHKNSHPGERFLKNTQTLLTSFENKQERYFLNMLEYIRNVDLKISTQEKSFDSLLIISNKKSDQYKLDLEARLSEIAYKTDSTYKMSLREYEIFLTFLQNDSISNINNALDNMENTLCLKFNIDSLNSIVLHKLYKDKKVSYEHLIFFKQLLYVRDLKHKNLILRDVLETIIKQIASVCTHYYPQITRLTKEKNKDHYPLFELKKNG